MDEQEVWKDIPGTEGAYQASSLGRIRSVERRIPSIFNGEPCTRRVGGGVLKPRIMKSGHLVVDLGRIRRHAPVHALVALTFIGPRPQGLEVCHRDGNPTNNAIDNLRYDTRTNNLLDRYLAGGTLGKLKLPEISAIMRRIEEGKATAEIAQEFNVCTGTINRIKRGECKSCKLITEGTI